MYQQVLKFIFIYNFIFNKIVNIFLINKTEDIIKIYKEKHKNNNDNLFEQFIGKRKFEFYLFFFLIIVDKIFYALSKNFKM